MTPDELKPVLRDVHAYWFGTLGGPDDLPRDRMEIWFKQSDATDDEIRDRFGRFIAPAAEAPFDLATLTREEAVGLVVLLDQFPRNIFRASGESFAYDARAREIATELIGLGPRRYFHIERVFIALPFEHSESLDDQDYSVLIFAELAVSAAPSLKTYCQDTLDFATKHRDLIRRFGRFPHRNALLGRTSTPEEAAFLAEHGRGY
ncbi:MAG: DUF924 domain-containing protein [Rhizobiales bacterium]|nr:DUF924 domain-containing protein [Hyphomicrobiales bacterium]